MWAIRSSSSALLSFSGPDRVGRAPNDKTVDAKHSPPVKVG